MLENIELRKMLAKQEEDDEMAAIRSIQLDQENPQLQEPEEQESLQLFYKEVEQLGQERISELDKKMGKFDDIQKQIDLLNQ